MTTLYFVTNGNSNFICTEKGLEQLKKDEYTQYWTETNEPDPKSDEINEYEFNKHYQIKKIDSDIDDIVEV